MELSKDEFGPEYVVRVWDPRLKMEGFLVIDNTVLGPGKGGLRMTENVTLEEVFRLARTMTWKNALADLPFGGAKAGIVWPGGEQEKKKEFIQSFAKALKPFLQEGKELYISAPDVGTGEKEMKWFVEAAENFRAATGKPANMCVEITGSLETNKIEGARKINSGKVCGIPHEFGSTGWGVAYCVKTAAELLGLSLKGAKIALHGFGNVGSFTAKYLAQMGAKIIAVADKSGAIFSEEGLNIAELLKLSQERKPLSECRHGQVIPSEDFWKIETDILIPASVTDVITENNKNYIKTKLIIEAANIPMREKVEQELFQKGIWFVPDFVANAGGVISSYAEYIGQNPKYMYELVKEKIMASTRKVMERSIAQRENPRAVALSIAKAKIKKAAKERAGSE